MARQATQATIDATFTEVRTTRKPRELTVANQHGWGTLLLRVRHTQRGVTASWIIRYVATGEDRPTVPLGPYDARDQAGGMSRTTALAEFGQWLIRRREGKTLVKLTNHAASAYLTEDEARPVLPSETVAALFKCFMEDYSRHHNTAKTVAARWSMWNCHCGPLAAMRARDLRARHVMDLVLRPMIEAGKKTTADDVRKLLRAVYSVATQVHQGSSSDERLPQSLAAFNVELDPLASMKAIKGANKPRNRPMPLAAMVDAYPLIERSLAGDLARLAVLTAGTRFQQLARLTRNSFDLDMGTVRFDDVKGRPLDEPRVYTLPLGEEGKAVARRIMMALGDGPAPSAYLIGRRLSAALAAAGARTAENGRQARDIRSSFTTWMAGQKVGQNVSNWIQSHELGTLVARHYTGELESQVRQVMLRLERAVLGQETASRKRKTA